MSEKIGEQSLLKYEKLYNWGRTLITSGVIQNEDKFPSENILQKKFGYSRQTVRTALNQLEAEGLIKRVKGSGTYVSYEGNLRNGERPRIGLILSYFSDYLFPRVYDGIDSVMKEAGYDIDVAVTKNRLNDEAFIWKVCSTAMWQDLLLKEHAPFSRIRISVSTRRSGSGTFRRCLFTIIIPISVLTVWRCRTPAPPTS